jgi:prepilin-type N-terminal cleavage/methylation domain-containing protein
MKDLKFKISNFKFQITNKKAKSQRIGNWKLEIGNSLPSGVGYTLIELLVAVAIFTVLGTMTVSILSLTLRGAKKSDAIESVRQNGDIILSKMVRTIRYASSIDNPICTDSITTPEITITALDNTSTTLSCSSVPNAIAVNGVSLVDTNAVLVQNCSFTCRQPVGASVPAVTIKFTLSARDSTGLFENKVSIPFQSSVNIRNATR